ncbi:DUF4232 domain-containing protein [Kitasatospora purpeofusca]|uniref:DUF4232 domain-containing protein n=1 Tax=Kitasatospora purpeofusca TaxID=67352 RepID=UPI002A5993BA|nr:DUF4232 domain-containing protein [Kitasatospora purpeofusca]MDY0813059.1 DUF4232 domain-containing protein [Kitasatospora purpeofusca]
MSARRTLLVPAALVGVLLAVSGCGPDDPSGPGPAQAATGTPAAVPTGAPASAPISTPAGAPTTAASTAATGDATAAPVTAAPKATVPATPSAAAPGGGGADDSYAYTHPCDAKDLTIRVTARTEAPSQRVIEVHNQGARSCGLSYFPLVSLGDSHAADRAKDIRPLVPGGLGGPPAYPVGAGRTAFAVIDLNPGGGTAATTAGVDQLNVLADGDHMPTAETRNFPLGPGAKVRAPKLGLYRATAADAVASAATADQQQS